MHRYYVAHNSWFDTHSYDRTRIALLVRKEGGTNIRLAHEYGRTNLPRVVTFSVSAPVRATQIERALNRAFQTQWIRVLKEDW